MKRCRKSQPEPDGLAAFREANPDGTWERFRDESVAAHKEVVARLTRDQGGICAYCEINVDPDRDRRVEHFHPKSDLDIDMNWHLDWNNLWLCCHGGEAYPTEKAREEGRTKEPRSENLSCDARKGNAVLDAQILNPGEIPAFPRLFKFRIGDGEIQVDEDACLEANIDRERVQRTIDILGLNCLRLREARSKVIWGIEQRIKTARLRKDDGDLRTQTYKYLLDRFLTKNEAGVWPRFFTLARWRLGKHAENHLRSENKDPESGF